MGVYLYTDEWTPNKNTIAYYPLTSTSTVNDLSWNNRTLTNYNNVAFGTYAWVDCAAFSWNKMILYHSDFPARWYGDYTMWCWMYTTSNNLQYVLSFWNAVATALVMQIKNWHIDPNIWNVSLNSWHHIVYTIASNTLKMYVDGTEVYTWTYNVNGSKSLWIGRQTFTDTYNYMWYMSEVIVENKARTATEIANYYNTTKSNYWL